MHIELNEFLEIVLIIGEAIKEKLFLYWIFSKRDILTLLQEGRIISSHTRFH